MTVCQSINQSFFDVEKALIPARQTGLYFVQGFEPPLNVKLGRHFDSVTANSGFLELVKSRNTKNTNFTSLVSFNAWLGVHCSKVTA